MGHREQQETQERGVKQETKEKEVHLEHKDYRACQEREDRRVWLEVKVTRDPLESEEDLDHQAKMDNQVLKVHLELVGHKV